jgi:hypothetical protein
MITMRSEHPDADETWLPDGEIWTDVEGDPAPLPRRGA